MSVVILLNIKLHYKGNFSYTQVSPRGLSGVQPLSKKKEKKKWAHLDAHGIGAVEEIIMTHVQFCHPE